MLDLPIRNYTNYIFYFDDKGNLKSNSAGYFDLNRLLYFILKNPEMILKKEPLDDTELNLCNILGVKWITSNETDPRYVELWQGEEKPKKEYNSYYRGKDCIATIDRRFFLMLEMVAA